MKVLGVIAITFLLFAREPGVTRAAAGKAMDLDPNLAEAYTASGMIKLIFD